MLLPRIIPVLTIQENGLVKTRRFRSPVYIGDPVNAVRIFNEKGADELLILDLDASDADRPMDPARLEEMTGEAFMPVAYGGGIRTLADVERVIKCGVEKVVINSVAVADPAFVASAANAFGSSAVVVSIDYRKTLFGGVRVYSRRGRTRNAVGPVDAAVRFANEGAGELLLHNVDRDGMMKGYDIVTLLRVTASVNVPVTVCGGAGRMDDLSLAFANGASGAAAGSLFVFSGPHRAVLINYPDEAWRSRLPPLI